MNNRASLTPARLKISFIENDFSPDCSRSYKSKFSIPANWEKWDGAHIPNCRIIAKDGPQTNGWAALSPVSERIVYEGVAEVSIYLTKSSLRKGGGKRLLKPLIELSERESIWTLESTMFPEYTASCTVASCKWFQRGRLSAENRSP